LILSDSSLFIDPNSLAEQVTSAAFQKGLDLYRTQGVFESSVSRGSQHEWVIDGVVYGGKYEDCSVEVTLETNDAGRIIYFDSECTCTAISPCKHAVAVTIRAAYKSGSGSSSRAPAPAQKTAAQLQAEKEAKEALALEREREQAQQKVTQWLDLFGNQLPEPSEANAALREPHPQDPDQVVFMLSAKVQRSQPVLSLAAGTTRRLRNGAWAKFKHTASFYSHHMFGSSAEVISLIKSLPSPQYNYNSYKETESILSGATGLLALELASATGFLFSTTAERVLGNVVRKGPARTMAWKWNEVTSLKATEPSWALTPRLADNKGSAQWFFNNPPLYLDAQAGLYGLLEMPGVSSEHLALLLNAPPIPQSAFALHETTLLRRLAGLPLPPVMKAPEVLQGISPTARLHITPVSAADASRLGLLRATLQFDYGTLAHYTPSLANPVLIEQTIAHAVPTDGTAVPAIKRTLLHRDLPQELAVQSALHALGLAGDGLGYFHLPFLSASEQQRWLQWADEDFAALRSTGCAVTLDPRLNEWIARADDLHVQLAGQGIGDNADGGDLVGGDDSQSPWFDLSLGMSIDGQRHHILPLLPELLAQLQAVQYSSAAQASDPASTADATTDTAGVSLQMPPYVYLQTEHGKYLRLPTEPLRPWLQALLELFGERPLAKGTESLRLSRLEAMRLGAALGAGAQWAGADSLRNMVRQLSGAVALPEIALPSGVRAELRHYQQQGLNWLQFLRTHQLAGILADDMGLGKTLQTLVHIACEKAEGRLDRPVLIVAPVSLLGNWRREIERFTPELSCMVWHGSERHGEAERIAAHDIVITPYSLLARDRERWAQQPWHLVVLDEAQNIKNALTHAAQAAGELNTRHRLCLSGTPMENHLGELWSLFHFLMPGFLGSQQRFKELFRTPIEKHADSERLDHLRKRVTPFMLRRAKSDVATELPDKQTSITSVELGDKQANLYETIRLTTEQAVRDALANKGLARSHIQVLDALLKLRQVCCDPRLVPLASAKKIKQSAKLELLMELLPELLAQGRKVLLFSQFTSMLELIEEELKKQSIPWVKLTGQSQNRDALITRFTSGEVPLFLISLKAGGVGLNLTQADTVIHYDPWWNPAVENQATDRAHRIGQTQQVMVYKLVAQGTIEERMLQLQERKAQLADSLYSAAAARKQPLFTENDLAELLKPLNAIS
jgi:superfamily II DNA or RNA helicase